MNFHAPVPYRSYSERLSEHYAAVRARLGAPQKGDMVPEARPNTVLLLDFHPEAHVVDDLVPNQRRACLLTVERISADAEIVAARRTLAAFARLRTLNPTTNSATHLVHAAAIGFKVDIAVIVGRSRRPGPVRIRQIAMYLAHQVCGVSREAVSRRFDRNHATVLHAERKFQGLLDGAASHIRSLA
jgi:hypothetical protein